MSELTAAFSASDPRRSVTVPRSIPVSLSDMLLWMVVLLCPFQDTGLQNTALKLPAASLSFFPLVALFLLTCATRYLHHPFRVNRKGFLITTYVVLVCAVNLIGVNEGGDVVLHTASAFADCVLTGLIIFVIFGLHYRPTRGLRLAVYSAFALTIIGIVCSQALGSNAIPFLQTTPSLTDRPRGFSTEASTLSVQIVGIGMLAAHFLRRPWQKVSAGTLTCALLIFSSSKGGFISLMLCALVLAIARTRSSIWAKVVALVVVLPPIYFGSLLMLSRFGTLIEANETATIATRLSMVVFAFFTVAHNPLGVGFTGFLPSIPRYLPPAMRFIQRMFPFPLWFGEAKKFLDPPYTDADCKTFFLNYLTFFGIPFAIMYFRFFWNLLQQLMRLRLNWLFLGVLFSFVATMTYYSTINAFILPLLIGISVHEIRATESPLYL